MVPCDGLVGHDRGGGAGFERRNACAQPGQEPAADHDVIGTAAERDVHDHRLAGPQRRGHDETSAIVSGRCDGARPSGAATAAMISLTMVSCATSRDITVTS